MRVCPGCRASYDDHVIVCPEDNLPLIVQSKTFGSLDKVGEQQEDTALTPGLMVGEFRVEGVIAKGGMGAIFAGIHPLIKKRVAIKVINKTYAEDPKAVSRFVMEATSVNEIGHHNIVDIFSIGELDDGRNYMIMELLDGLGLHEILQREKRLEPGEVLPIYEQLCDALDSAHAKGFIHRDLKPENVVVLRRPPHPFIKILDFGLAKLKSGSKPDTEVATVAGTPAYMAPEQCRGEPVDATTDLYSIGVMLYELVTGQRPFSDRSVHRILNMQQVMKPRPPTELARVSEQLEQVILKAMSKSRSGRYQSARELIVELKLAIPAPLPWRASLDPVAAVSPQQPKALSKEVPIARPPPMSPEASVLAPESIAGEIPDDELETQQAEIKFRRQPEAPRTDPLDEQPTDIYLGKELSDAELEVPEPASALGRPTSLELRDMDDDTEVSSEPPIHEIAPTRGTPSQADVAALVQEMERLTQTQPLPTIEERPPQQEEQEEQEKEPPSEAIAPAEPASDLLKGLQTSKTMMGIGDVGLIEELTGKPAAATPAELDDTAVGVGEVGAQEQLKKEATPDLDDTAVDGAREQPKEAATDLDDTAMGVGEVGSAQDQQPIKEISPALADTSPMPVFPGDVTEEEEEEEAIPSGVGEERDDDEDPYECLEVIIGQDTAGKGKAEDPSDSK